MARTRGAELNVDAVLGRGVCACLGATYVDARYLDFQNAPWNFPIVHGTCPGGSSAQGYIAGLCTPIAGDASGRRMVQAPPWRISGCLGYEVDMVLGKLSADANAAYTASFFWDSDNFLTQKAYALVNASLTLVPAVARNTSIRLWGYNITREKYYVFELPVAGGAGNLAHPGAPCTFGVEFRMKLE